MTKTTEIKVMIKSYDELIECVKQEPKKTIAVAMAQDDDVLLALAKANDAGIADAVLIGDKNEITARSVKIGVDLSKFDIIDEHDEKRAVVRSIQLVREGLANTLMKGKCNTATLLRGVLDKDHGLRRGKFLSHLGVFELPAYPKLLLMSDAALNIAPDLETKIVIAENAINAAHLMNIQTPKVAFIAAVEKVNPDAMPCTTDAAIISKMGQRGQIKGAIIDGPLALDNAVNAHACAVKGIKSKVGGDADILIMPNIETANCFYKTMAYLAQAKTAGVIVGAKAPVILTSRADSDETKFLSIALALFISQRR